MVEKLDTGRLNELAEFFVLDYLKKQGVAPDSVVCIDIDGLTTDYFGYRVVYENIAEDDLSKTAFAPNGVKPLKVKRNGTVVSIVFPAD